jgi:hypothetical protein
MGDTRTEKTWVLGATFADIAASVVLYLDWITLPSSSFIGGNRFPERRALSAFEVASGEKRTEQHDSAPSRICRTPIVIATEKLGINLAAHQPDPAYRPLHNTK